MGRLIYAADDEKDILDVLKDFLENAGFRVETFRTGDALLERFRKVPCDLAVLDIMMPGTDGLAVCRELRRLSDIPIVILTARKSESDQLRGYMQGCDDYLIKPFSPSILVVKIKAMLRRTDSGKPADNRKALGDITLSHSLHDVICGENSLGLTVTEFALMACLIEEPGKAVARDELLDRVWGIDSDEIETRVTDETVRRIRQKLKSAGSSVRISAVWGYGYKLENGAQK